MNGNQSDQLRADGYRLLGRAEVGVPHYVWKIDIEYEQDRELRLVEETVLRLLDANVGDPEQVAHLMGLDDVRIVQRTIVDLMTRGAIVHRDGVHVLGLPGRSMLDRAVATLIETRDGIDLVHDPFRDEFAWKRSEPVYSDRDLKDQGMHALPAPIGLTGFAVESRHPDIQRLLDRYGLPWEANESALEGGQGPTPPNRVILRVQPLHSYVTYRKGELEVWRHQTREDWQWRFLRGGGEEREVTSKLREMELDGQEILPLERMPDSAEHAGGDGFPVIAESAAQGAKTSVLSTEEHRGALREAILDAKLDLIIVSPWLRTAAVDDELLGWLRQALDRQKQLRVKIGYGIEKGDKRQTGAAARSQKESLKRLQRVAQRTRGRLRLVKIGRTHEKVVVSDDHTAIVTSYNFLSFNPKPGKGIRLEMGIRLTDPALVADIRRRCESALLE